LFTVSKLRIIKVAGGNVRHGIKSSEKTFSTFGELYFSEVKNGIIKGWKKHNRMIVNIIPVMGAIRLYIKEKKDSPIKSLIISDENYVRVTIEPNTWFAFEGLADKNMLANLASIEHDIYESENHEFNQDDRVQED